MHLGIFDRLPDDVLEIIYKHVHQERMREVFGFIKKYVPNSTMEPIRRFNGYNLSYDMSSMRHYKLHHGVTCFSVDNTPLERKLVNCLLDMWVWETQLG